MSDTETRILEVFGKAIPLMTETEKDRLLAFGEGMALMARKNHDRRDNRYESASSVRPTA